MPSLLSFPLLRRNDPRQPLCQRIFQVSFKTHVPSQRTNRTAQRCQTVRKRIRMENQRGRREKIPRNKTRIRLVPQRRPENSHTKNDRQTRSLRDSFKPPIRQHHTRHCERNGHFPPPPTRQNLHILNSNRN